jgi:hypothetical protein
MERSKKIYVLWYRSELITYFDEDQLDDMLELIIDLNFEEAYCHFCEALECGDELLIALNYSQYAECWHWHDLERLV